MFPAAPDRERAASPLPARRKGRAKTHTGEKSGIRNDHNIAPPADRRNRMRMTAENERDFFWRIGILLIKIIVLQ